VQAPTTEPTTSLLRWSRDEASSLVMTRMRCSLYTYTGVSGWRGGLVVLGHQLTQTESYEAIRQRLA